MLDLLIDHDKCCVEGTTVPRPTHVSPSQWFDFWDQKQDPYATKIESLREELKEANEKIDELTDSNDAYKELIGKIQDALGTEESKDDLVHVAKAAHKAELILADVENAYHEEDASFTERLTNIGEALGD